MVDALRRNVVTSFMASISTYKTDLEDKLKERTRQDTEYQKMTKNINWNISEKVITDYIFNEQSLIMFKTRLYVLNICEVKMLILNEIHKSPYFGHPGYQKMITMLRK